MSAPSLFLGLEKVKLPKQPLHLAIGMFDGVHLGHQAVIEAAVHSALRSGGLAGVLSFWPHPSALVHPERRTRLIMAPETKVAMLSRLGVDFIIQQPFGEDFAKIRAEEFLPWLNKGLPLLKAIYVGENWRFGAGRNGDVSQLIAFAGKLGLSVFSAPRVQYNGEAISSTRIRNLLATGDLVQANEMLGYSYFSDEESIPGRRLGRTIGFPTLNLPWEPELQPAYGVYAVRVSRFGGKEALPGVANYGLRPTVEEAKSPLLEVHMLGACPFACGDKLHVEWLRFLRPERRFAGVEELKNQIAKDRDAALAFFSQTGISE
jgi:riboflavin kinase/FMN adenylyltransferase